MKGRLIKVLLSGALAALGTTAAIAATDTVLITGTVSEVVTVSIAPNSNSFTITPEVAVTNQNIATITINSNDPQGYDVTLTGTHATSVLENAAADETIAYTVKYNGGAATSVTTTPTNVENTTAQTAGDVTRTFTLDITGPASLGRSAEAFTDTVTVTILGK